MGDKPVRQTNLGNEDTVPAHAKMKIETAPSSTTLECHFSHKNDLECRKTLHALRSSVERITGVRSVVNTRHSLIVTVDQPGRQDEVIDQIERLFRTHLGSTPFEYTRAALAPA